jgi:hypothetical protein
MEFYADNNRGKLVARLLITVAVVMFGEIAQTLGCELRRNVALRSV